MGSSGVRVRVWCEDDRHEQFARQLLAKFGIERRSMQVNKAPKGEGAASAWVTKRYHDEVLPTYRRVQNHQAGLGFLVIVDGDDIGFQGRLSALKADERAPSDRIAILAPTWSVETWVLWLSGESVTESEKTKLRLSHSEFGERLKAGIAGWDHSRDDELPAITNARTELAKLPRSR